MTYEISEPHEPKAPMKRGPRSPFAMALIQLPVGKALTITREDVNARNVQKTASAYASIIAKKYIPGGKFSTCRVGDHSVQITRLA